MRTEDRCPWALVATAALACGATACDAKVLDFSATPRHICAGERVELRWDVRGSPTLSAAPAVAGLPPSPDARGGATIAPTQTTRVDLAVSRFLGASTTSTQEIVVRDASDAAESLAADLGDDAATPGCGEGKVWATIHAKRFSSTMRATRVASHPGDARTYEIEHAGVRATLTPGAALSDFAASSIDGDWVLRSPLAPGEACGTPTLPHDLVIDVFTQCVPSGGT